MNANETTAGGNTIQLTLAWLWVGIPLTWGVWLTLNNALKLFTSASPT